MWDFTLANYDSVWKLLVQIGLLLIFLLIGNILRNTIPFLKKFLIPSALIGGVLLFLCNYILSLFNITLVDKSIMQVITYHCLAIGFIAMSLKIVKKNKKIDKMKVIENGALTGGSYMLQALLGLGISIIFYYVTCKTSETIYYGTGLLLPLGYGQGPGNALIWDINFSNLVDENGASLFSGNGSVGLSIASIGFIVASVVGVIYINIFKKKGQIIIKERPHISEKDISIYEEENEIPDSESIDKFSIQICIVALVYALVFGFMALLGSLSSFTNSLAWGFNFLWGVFIASLVKLIYRFLRKKKIIKRKYINNYQMDRISGFSFDLMIVAGVSAIEINDIKKYLLLIIVLCVVGAIGTYAFIRIVTKHCFKGYEHQMFVANFATVTGTASNGMILLKEIDPNFETPTSDLFVLSQFPAMIFVCPLLLILNFASASLTHAFIALGIFTILFIAYFIFLMRKAIFKKKHK